MSIPALILAGGLGTRLRHLIPDLPKPLAPVANKPFLYYLLKHLQNQGVRDVYLSVGYKAEKIKDYFHHHFHSIQLHYIKEEEPLGTGGAIAFALQQIPSENVLILNGDTFLNFELNKLLASHQNQKLTIALNYAKNSDRYGFVNVDKNYVSGFIEKSSELRDGWINAGVYVLNKNFYLSHIPSQKIFSFEKDFLEKIYRKYPINTYKVNGYFIDIGVPNDYTRAQKEFAQLHFLEINNEWTLFLDRDGVINKKLHNDYVKSIEEFEWLENVIDALKILRKIFGKIIVVTNQQGIGKGLMTDDDLHKVHQFMQQVLANEGIVLDKIYYAPELATNHSLKRKPNIGMALEAKKDFPNIQFAKSIMVGDSLSDVQFAHNAGMYSVYLASQPESFIPYDFTFSDLYEFAKCFEK